MEKEYTFSIGNVTIPSREKKQKNKKQKTKKKTKKKTVLCDTYNCDYLKHSTFGFKFYIDFQLNTDFPFQFCVFFTVKSPSVTQRLVSQENAF